MTAVQFPEMRLEVIGSLESLSDPDRQKLWGKVEEGVSYYDDFTMNVNILYDDCRVLPEPSGTVGSVLLEGDVDALRRLGNALHPLLEELGEAPDAAYVADSRWPTVMSVAAEALRVMMAADRSE